MTGLSTLYPQRRHWFKSSPIYTFPSFAKFWDRMKIIIRSVENPRILESPNYDTVLSVGYDKSLSPAKSSVTLKIHGQLLNKNIRQGAVRAQYNIVLLKMTKMQIFKKISPFHVLLRHMVMWLTPCTVRNDRITFIQLLTKTFGCEENFLFAFDTNFLLSILFKF